jgi:hypothetical protein
MRLIELIKHRPLQFCLFLSTLFGEKQMDLLMISAIKNARVVGGQSAGPEERCDCDSRREAAERLRYGSKQN